MHNLKDGDLIGIISPSAPISAFCPRRLDRGIKYLEKLGFRVLLGKHVSAVNRFTAGTPQERADDINFMFNNSDAKAIIVTIGGYNANDVLDLIDYELIKKNNNKLLIGYSDASLLLHALYKKSGVRGIMGPMILPQFAEYPEMQKFSLNSFFEVVKNLGKNKVYELPKAEEYTEEMLLWDQEDIKSREMKKNSGWEIIFSGKASGRLVPTNLNTLCKLIGTPYMPDLEGAILFLEDDGDESAATIQRMLQHLKQAGQLDWIKGIVFGRFQEKSEITNDDIKFLLGNVFNEVSFPVISNVDFGHTDPMITLPIGNSVSISTQLSQIKITL